ncbi:hypothetical protein HDV00_004323 [Rhizophlyctis rosea]|nr:hypothetical protein HDV00_004323 [Rhizophlyctis rosea]
MHDVSSKRKSDSFEDALKGSPSTEQKRPRLELGGKDSGTTVLACQTSQQENLETLRSDASQISRKLPTRPKDEEPCAETDKEDRAEQDEEWVEVTLGSSETAEAPKRLSYLDQMSLIIDAVQKDESHLLDEKDQSIINAYLSLPNESKEVYFKLLNNRTFKYERVDKLNYPFIESLERAIQFLKSAGFLDDAGPESIDEWMSLLRRDELVDLAKDRRVSATGKSITELRNAIMKSSRSQPLLQFMLPASCGGGSSKADKALLLHVQRKIGKVIKLSTKARDTFHRVFIIYNRTREWPEDEKFMTNSILTNLRDKARKFPTYNVHRTSLIWPTREDLLSYVRLLQLEFRVARMIEKNTMDDYKAVVEVWEECRAEWEDCVKERKGHVTEVPWFQVFTPGWILTRIMQLCAHALFRLKEYRRQVELLRQLLDQRMFCPARRGAWYDDVVRILHNYIDQQEAARVCCLALEDPFVVTGHRSSIQKRLRRLYKGKLKPETVDFGKPGKIIEQTIRGIKTFSEANRKSLWQGEDGEEVNVEELCLQYYRRDGWKGFHSENSIITTLFGVLFWDILFDDSVPGVFSSPYQVAPLDLHTEFFYEARKDLIEQRLAEIDAEEHLRLIATVDDRERPAGTFCRGVSWKNFTKEEILEIAECVGGPALSRICRLFAKTYWAHSGGVPDLW